MGKSDDEFTTSIVHLVPMSGYVAAYIRHRNQRSGRHIRHAPDVVRVPWLPGESLSDVLRRVAQSLELPPSVRWRPPA